MKYVKKGDAELVECLKRHSIVDREQKDRYNEGIDLLMKDYNERRLLIIKLNYEPLEKLNSRIEDLLLKKSVKRKKFETSFEDLNAKIESILSYKLNIERPERNYIKGERPIGISDDKIIFGKLSDGERNRLFKLNRIVGNRIHNLTQFKFYSPWKKCSCNERKYYRIRNEHFVGVKENFCWSDSIQLWTRLKIHLKENDGIESQHS